MKTKKPDTYTVQGAENLGRDNPAMVNPYPIGDSDWRAFKHGQSIAKRRQIVELMKQRAQCTAKSKAAEFFSLTKKIDALQRKIDGK